MEKFDHYDLKQIHKVTVSFPGNKKGGILLENQKIKSQSLLSKLKNKDKYLATTQALTRAFTKNTKHTKVAQISSIV